MSAETPEHILELWLAAFRSNDLPALVSLYDREYALVPAPGVAPVVGIAGAEGSLAQLLTLGVEFDFLDATSVERGDVAFVSAAWTERGVGPDGSYEFETHTSDMLRRQADGTWKFLVNTLARDVRS